jgi:hypothetical protein
MQGPTLYLEALSAVAIALDIWATAVVARERDLLPAQRRNQIIFLWLLPIAGALMAFEFHRRSESRRGRSFVAADDLFGPANGGAAGNIQDSHSDCGP